MPRDQHNISRQNIGRNALKVLYRLNDAGYDAYLVGGGVRDLLLGLNPKDFDIATNATPEQIKKLFNNCRLIGRRFRLAHIVFGREIIEVATFRGHHEPAKQQDAVSHQNEHGQLLRDNVYGSIDEDAERRDFSINALYYSVADYSIRDYWGGVQAIANREISLIGDPEIRYREDPVRMLRAVRFAVKLDMQIAQKTADPINELASLLKNIPPARIFEECLKLFLGGKGQATFDALLKYELFQQIFWPLKNTMKDKLGHPYQMFSLALANTDDRISAGKRVTPAFLFATLYWHLIDARKHELQNEGGLSTYDAYQVALGDILDTAAKSVMIPKRFASMIRDIWQLQPRLEQRHGNKPFKLIEHPKFRAAYDFLLLRAEVEKGHLVELAQWWTEFQTLDDAQKRSSVRNNNTSDDKKPRRRRRRVPRKRKPASSE
ncbi:polynucleotide adenylyltransferase PcnB [Saccharobesus litoralis]|uniref:Poly(A) polymerase I n=1 Tax=Saccharobesus litoralis TaxID=2172099 RepID=A0A2S0VXP6_9ALTE|nr:polynucleotide adenylyltransferase PcnB [Saccharobesus litoralis]AWB68999.1 polynucleotide adenylyltransferase PcnB [Saccharobesus litoralis]